MTLVDVSCSPVLSSEQTEQQQPSPAEEEPTVTAPVAEDVGAVEACTGCVQLHKDIRQNMELMMHKFDSFCERFEVLIASVKEKEKVGSASNGVLGLGEHMSESGSEEKYAPSPSGSRGSPSSTHMQNGKTAMNGGSKKRKPTKESVNRINCFLENLGGSPVDANAFMSRSNGSPAEKMSTNSRQTPASANSPFPDFNNFNQFMFDPMSNPQNMMQLLNLVQQQQHQAAQQQKAEMGKVVVKSEEPERPQTVQVKQEPPEQLPTPPNEQHLLDQLSAQFVGVGEGVSRSDNRRRFQKAPSPTVHASVGRGSPDDEPNSTVSRCSNCSTMKTTAWRRDLAGKLVCNACGLYFRLHRTHRPVHMRKDFIQQRFRRKIKEEENPPASQSLMLGQLFANAPKSKDEENPAASQSAMLGQLFGMPQMGSGCATNAFQILEQFNQLNNQSQEQLNSSAPPV